MAHRSPAKVRFLLITTHVLFFSACINPLTMGLSWLGVARRELAEICRCKNIKATGTKKVLMKRLEDEGGYV